MPSYPQYVAGAAKTWLNTAGTYAITLTSLTNTSTREGGKGDFYDATYGLPEYLMVRLETAVGSAATDGNSVELWFGESDSATAGMNNPGNLTGADAGVTNGDQLRRQLSFCGAMSLSNARGTNVQKQWFQFFPGNRYLIPVIYNASGQTLSGTAGNHGITVVPYYRVIN